MNRISSFGDHTIYAYDTTKHQFLEFFQTLYGTTELNMLHTTSDEFSKPNIHDIETSLHKAFYAEIKSNPRFKQLYCEMIRSIHQQFFPDEHFLIYQSFPSIRFQFINNIAVPPHCDSDDLGKHPIGEKNFLLPITEMVRTKRLFIESEPKKGDFQGIDLTYGQLLYFNGNKCIHYNEVNTEDTIRISLDFRIMKQCDYIHYIQSGDVTTTNPRDPEKKRVPTKMVIGGYYQLTSKAESLDEMMNWHFQKQMLLQSQPNFGNEEATACYEYMKDGVNFVTEFKQTAILESMIAEYTGAKHVCMTTSGNMAIVLALLACEIGPGDEVIVPNYTMIATINSIKFVGATPVIIDVDSETLTISRSGIHNARTDKTKAVLHVSLNNRHCTIEEIAAYCKQEGLLCIEDAAQSLGCMVNGRHFGRFGTIGCFSLSTPKIISTGQGGFCITDDDELARKLGMIKNFGRKCGGIDIFETFGLNAKFTDIQAVIGIEQMKKLPERVTRMRAIFDRYYSYLHAYMKPAPFATWIPWFVDIFIPNRDELMKFLLKHNIQTRATYPEINRTPMYTDSVTHPVSSYVSANGLFLPSHTVLHDSEIDHICKLIQFYTSI